jgi:LPXTG-motif cell wall-anchored protein
MVESMADGADARSDDKGTEPEAVAVGRIGDRQYAFIGLERQGGIMVYDVTDPSAPAFEDYVNLALSELASGGDFTGPGTTDVSPEGVVFVSASSSPNGEPLVIVANELSGTTTVYAVRGAEIDSALATVATLPATGGTMDVLILALIAIAGGGTLLATRRRA